MKHVLSRRDFWSGAGVLLAVGSLPARLLHAADALRFATDPFTLGVASGYPTPTSVVLWTRLAPEPGLPSGGIAPTEAVPVTCEIATDERMRHIVRSEQVFASAQHAHSIHYEPRGLSPARDYWYRFAAGGFRSAIGRTRTAPAGEAAPRELRLGVASCQHYEQGYYTAYRHMLADELDAILHVGDYIYESGPSNSALRRHTGGPAITLDDYRLRYALYRSDPDLQAAHARYPWLLTWDDHEVENDYAGESSPLDESREQFLERRAAAYQAYYEHLPLPQAAAPTDAGLQLFTQRAFGGLVNIMMLDTRQYRSPLACATSAMRGAHAARCPELRAAERTKLGMAQERWLERELAQSEATWNVLAQGTVMTNIKEGRDGDEFWTDSWNGYRAARDRLTQVLGTTHARNPLVLSGDIHAFIVANVQRLGDDASSPVVASEFVTTSISSQGRPQEAFDVLRPNNPNLLLANSAVRGYVRLHLSAARTRADLIAMDSVATRDAAAKVLASYVVEDGRPGPIATS